MKGLLGDAWDMVSGTFGGLLQIDPALKDRRAREAKELYEQEHRVHSFRCWVGAKVTMNEQKNFQLAT